MKLVAFAFHLKRPIEMLVNSKPQVVIVDGYKFSKDFAENIRSYHFGAIHVFSSEKPIPAMQVGSTYDKSDYTETLYFSGNLTQTVKQLSQYKIVAVVPATEPGVLLADQLADQLQSPNNGLTHSQARRNKYLMLEAVKQRNLPIPKFLATAKFNKIKNWIITQRQPYPIVLKPLSEAGTVGVHIVNNDQQLEQAFLQLQNLETLLLKTPSKKILVEEFLHGEEYVINTVSHNGQHSLVDIWRYHKTYTESGYCLYDKTILQQSNFENNERLISYVFSVLDALDIKFGVCHCEVMLTEKGPRLIEVGARISGLSDKVLWNRCLGFNQVDLCLASYLNPNFDSSFLNNIKIRENAVAITLANDKYGKIIELPDDNVIKKYKSYYKHTFNCHIGQMIAPTTTLMNAPGRIILIHRDIEVMLKDCESIKKYCAESFKIKSDLCEPL